MTDDAIAAATVTVRALEMAARQDWDRLAAEGAGEEQQVAMTVARQAGAVRRALEQWIVVRATTKSAATR